MYEMPLTFVFGVWGFGVEGEHFFRIGVLGVCILSLAFCPEVEFMLLTLVWLTLGDPSWLVRLLLIPQKLAAFRYKIIKGA